MFKNFGKAGLQNTINTNGRHSFLSGKKLRFYIGKSKTVTVNNETEYHTSLARIFYKKDLAFKFGRRIAKVLGVELEKPSYSACNNEYWDKEGKYSSHNTANARSCTTYQNEVCVLKKYDHYEKDFYYVALFCIPTHYIGRSESDFLIHYFSNACQVSCIVCGGNSKEYDKRNMLIRDFEVKRVESICLECRRKANVRGCHFDERNLISILNERLKYETKT